MQSKKVSSREKNLGEQCIKPDIPFAFKVIKVTSVKDYNKTNRNDLEASSICTRASP